MLSYIQRIQIIHCIARTKDIHACKEIIYKMYGAIFLAIISIYMPIIPSIHGISEDIYIFMATIMLAYWGIIISIASIEEEVMSIVIPSFGVITLVSFVSIIQFRSEKSYYGPITMMAIIWITHIFISVCYGIIYHGYAGTIIREHGPTLSHHQRMTIMRRHPTFAQYIHPPIPSHP